MRRKIIEYSNNTPTAYQNDDESDRILTGCRDSLVVVDNKDRNKSAINRVLSGRSQYHQRQRPDNYDQLHSRSDKHIAEQVKAGEYSHQAKFSLSHTNNRFQNIIKMAKSRLRYNYHCNKQYPSSMSVEPLIVNNDTNSMQRHSLAIGVLMTCLLGVTLLPGHTCLTASVDAKSSTIKQRQQSTFQSRSGPIEPIDYMDDASEFEALANQQQIPTAQLMAAAGHVVPENFFLPGGSIPASHYGAAPLQRINVPTYVPLQQHHQSGGNIGQSDVMHSTHGRHATGKLTGARQPQASAMDHLLTAASSVDNEGPLVDYSGYNLATQPDGREVGTPQVDLIEFLNEQRDNQAAQSYQYQQHQQVQQPQQQAPIHYTDQMSDYEPVGPVANQRSQNIEPPLQQPQPQQQTQLQQQQQAQQTQMQQTANDQQMLMASNEQMISVATDNQPGMQYIGPDYQIIGQSPSQDYIMVYNNEYQATQKDQQQKPYGLPTKSSSKEPSGMLKPIGNPKTISSPVIDFAASTLPKTTVVEKVGEKLPPPPQPPTVFSFASSKDPADKGKAIMNKKRNTFRQAENMVRGAIKAFNDKFGTNLGDATDIPFLLSTLGPLGFAQNLLFDPTLFVTLINSAEKALMDDVLPGSAKFGIRTVLNVFRVPNKKRDKANLLNIISYLASGGQTPSSVPSKHRQGSGIAKSVKQSNKNNR